MSNSRLVLKNDPLKQLGQLRSKYEISTFDPLSAAEMIARILAFVKASLTDYPSFFTLFHPEIEMHMREAAKCNS